MMTPICPECSRVIPGDDINVAHDVAFCRPCNLSHKLSELARNAELDAGVNLSDPAPGAWRRGSGTATIIGATHRSLGTAIGALAISLFWNGIVSVFVLLAIAGTLRNLGITAPEWFPAPNMNGSGMSTGMTIFLWIFLTPFIVVGLVMISVFLSSLGGRTEVRIQNAEGSVFSGIGPVGIRRRFDATAVKNVTIVNNQWRDSDGDKRSKTCIVIETREGKQIKFGSMLTEERRKFVAAATRRELLR